MILGTEQRILRLNDQGINEVLKGLPVFDDIFLEMQALNMDLVDSFIEDQEASLLREYMELERTPIASALFVSALSQLWIFGLYELLRTWRQRAKQLLSFANKLQDVTPEEKHRRIRLQRIKMETAAEASLGMGHWHIFQKGMRSKRFLKNVQTKFDQTEILFRRIEALRISLAKHEIPKSELPALAPGYGRIDMTNGSIYWQIVLQGEEVDLISRRAIADACRRLAIDNSKLILPTAIQEKVAKFPTKAYGIKRVGVIMKNGTKYPYVTVAWNKQVIDIPGFQMKSFDARKVIDVCLHFAGASLLFR